MSDQHGGPKPPHARRRSGHTGVPLDAERTLRGHRAVETIYHAYLTGLILMAVSRRGAGAAAELVFRLFRRQQLEKFLPGLDPAVFDVWNELWVGALSIHERHLTLDVTRRPGAGDGRVEWRIVPRERR